MSHAWVTTNVLDLWSEPKFESERLSQLLFGEIVSVVNSKAGFCFISQVNGYTGWGDARFLQKISVDPAKSGKQKRGVVVARAAQLFGPDKKQTIAPHLVYYGTVLSSATAKGGFTKIVLPDSTNRFIKTSAIRPIINGKDLPVAGFRLVREARRFLGIPYLWGGVTSTGFDCSGLTQAVCARFGICLPRDTKDQILVGEEVRRQSIKSGDLLFFKRHVGFAVGKEQIIHASRGGGGVRIESLQAGMNNYRSDLDKDFATARRITSCSMSSQ